MPARDTTIDTRDPITLLCHPTCSKSREATALVLARASSVEVIDYVAAPLSYAALRSLLAKLDVPPIALVRTKDADIALSEDASAEDVARLLAEKPALMERPVLVVGERAIIARPPSRVAELLDPAD